PANDPSTGRTVIVVDAKTSEADPVDAGDAVKQERDQLQDRLLRTAAEFDNYRKRTERERRELSEAVSADLIRLGAAGRRGSGPAARRRSRLTRSHAAVRRGADPPAATRCPAATRRRSV